MFRTFVFILLLVCWVAHAEEPVAKKIQQAPTPDFITTFPYKYWFDGWMWCCWVDAQQTYRHEFISVLDKKTDAVTWVIQGRRRDGTIQQWSVYGRELPRKEFDATFEREVLGAFSPEDRRGFKMMDLRKVADERQLQRAQAKAGYTVKPERASK